MLPKNLADVEAFYRTLDRYMLALARHANDPWAEIPWPVEQHHGEIIAKLYARDDQYHEEIDAFLGECIRLRACSVKDRSSSAQLGSGCT